MAGINQIVNDLIQAAKNLIDTRDEEKEAQVDEEKKRKAAWKDADKALSAAKGKDAVKDAGRVYRVAQATWRAADTRRKKATLKRMEAEKKLREALKRFNDELLKLVFPR